MKFVLLGGAGKTGAVVAEVARERGHELRILEIDENRGGAALTRSALAGVDAVIDFTSPFGRAGKYQCLRPGRDEHGGGHDRLVRAHSRVRSAVEQAGTGLIFASNFSVGVNVFFKTIAAAAAALKHGYQGEILERHHIHKKDAPSGTAVTMQKSWRASPAASCRYARNARAKWSACTSLRWSRGRQHRPDTRCQEPPRLCRRGGAGSRVDYGQKGILRVQGHLRSAM